MNVQARATAFAEQVQDLLDATLPVAAGANPQDRRVNCLVLGENYAVHPGTTTKGALVPLLHAGRHVASLRLSYMCTGDTDGNYLAVQRSSFELKVHGRGDNNAPIFRLDYLRDAHSVPAAHWNVHAERGAVSHLLAQTNEKHQGMLSKIHLSVGGARGRPCLEDFLQMLLDEFRFDRVDGAREAIEAGREDWRRRQIATLVRDAPEVAVDTLSELGYTITEPPTGPRRANTAALRRG